MKDVTDLLSMFGGMPGAALAVLVVLAGFALAGFAIHAVLTVAKERRK